MPTFLAIIYIYTNYVCVCVCLSSIGGQTAGPIMTKFGTHMRIDLGMVPTKYWPHEWTGSVGSLGPISESGLSCQLLLRAVVWQMTSQLIRRRIRLGDFRGALLGHAHMRRSKLCSTKICESNRKCNVLIKDDGSDGVWEAQTILWMKTTMGINFTMKFLARLYICMK